MSFKIDVPPFYGSQINSIRADNFKPIDQLFVELADTIHKYGGEIHMMEGVKLQSILESFSHLLRKIQVTYTCLAARNRGMGEAFISMIHPLLNIGNELKMQWMVEKPSIARQVPIGMSGPIPKKLLVEKKFRRDTRTATMAFEHSIQAVFNQYSDINIPETNDTDGFRNAMMKQLEKEVTDQAASCFNAHERGLIDLVASSLFETSVPRSIAMAIVNGKKDEKALAEACIRTCLYTLELDKRKAGDSIKDSLRCFKELCSPTGDIGFNVGATISVGNSSPQELQYVILVSSAAMHKLMLDGAVTNATLTRPDVIGAIHLDEKAYSDHMKYGVLVSDPDKPFSIVAASSSKSKSIEVTVLKSNTSVIVDNIEDIYVTKEPVNPLVTTLSYAVYGHLGRLPTLAVDGGSETKKALQSGFPPMRLYAHRCDGRTESWCMSDMSNFLSHPHFYDPRKLLAMLEKEYNKQACFNQFDSCIMINMGTVRDGPSDRPCKAYENYTLMKADSLQSNSISYSHPSLQVTPFFQLFCGPKENRSLLIEDGTQDTLMTYNWPGENNVKLRASPTYVRGNMPMSVVSNDAFLLVGKQLGSVLESALPGSRVSYESALEVLRSSIMEVSSYIPLTLLMNVIIHNFSSVIAISDSSTINQKNALVNTFVLAGDIFWKRTGRLPYVSSWMCVKAWAILTKEAGGYKTVQSIESYINQFREHIKDWAKYKGCDIQHVSPIFDPRHICPIPQYGINSNLTKIHDSHIKTEIEKHGMWHNTTAIDPGSGQVMWEWDSETPESENEFAKIYTTLIFAMCGGRAHTVLVNNGAVTAWLKTIKSDTTKTDDLETWCNTTMKNILNQFYDSNSSACDSDEANQITQPDNLPPDASTSDKILAEQMKLTREQFERVYRTRATYQKVAMAHYINNINEKHSPQLFRRQYQVGPPYISYSDSHQRENNFFEVGHGGAIILFENQLLEKSAQNLFHFISFDPRFAHSKIPIGCNQPEYKRYLSKNIPYGLPSCAIMDTRYYSALHHPIRRTLVQRMESLSADMCGYARACTALVAMISLNAAAFASTLDHLHPTILSALVIRQDEFETESMVFSRAGGHIVMHGPPAVTQHDNAQDIRFDIRQHYAIGDNTHSAACMTHKNAILREALCTMGCPPVNDFLTQTNNVPRNICSVFRPCWQKQRLWNGLGSAEILLVNVHMPVQGQPFHPLMDDTNDLWLSSPAGVNRLFYESTANRNSIIKKLLIKPNEASRQLMSNMYIDRPLFLNNIEQDQPTFIHCTTKETNRDLSVLFNKVFSLHTATSRELMDSKELDKEKLQGRIYISGCNYITYTTSDSSPLGKDLGNGCNLSVFTYGIGRKNKGRYM